MTEQEEKDTSSFILEDEDGTAEEHALFQSVMDSSAAWATVNKPKPKGSNQHSHKKNATKLWTSEKVNDFWLYTLCCSCGDVAFVAYRTKSSKKRLVYMAKIGFQFQHILLEGFKVLLCDHSHFRWHTFPPPLRTAALLPQKITYSNCRLVLRHSSAHLFLSKLSWKPRPLFRHNSLLLALAWPPSQAPHRRVAFVVRS